MQPSKVQIFSRPKRAHQQRNHCTAQKTTPHTNSHLSRQSHDNKRKKKQRSFSFPSQFSRENPQPKHKNSVLQVGFSADLENGRETYLQYSLRQHDTQGWHARNRKQKMQCLTVVGFDGSLQSHYAFQRALQISTSVLVVASAPADGLLQSHLYETEEVRVLSVPRWDFGLLLTVSIDRAATFLVIPDHTAGIRKKRFLAQAARATMQITDYAGRHSLGILLTRGTQFPIPYKKIVVCTDGPAGSQPALMVATNVAFSSHASLQIVTQKTPPHSRQPSPQPRLISRFLRLPAPASSSPVSSYKLSQALGPLHAKNLRVSTHPTSTPTRTTQGILSAFYTDLLVTGIARLDLPRATGQDTCRLLSSFSRDHFMVFGDPNTNINSRKRALATGGVASALLLAITGLSIALPAPQKQHDTRSSPTPSTTHTTVSTTRPGPHTIVAVTNSPTTEQSTSTLPPRKKIARRPPPPPTFPPEPPLVEPLPPELPPPPTFPPETLLIEPLPPETAPPTSQPFPSSFP